MSICHFRHADINIDTESTVVLRNNLAQLSNQVRSLYNNTRLVSVLLDVVVGNQNHDDCLSLTRICLAYSPVLPILLVNQDSSDVSLLVICKAVESSDVLPLFQIAVQLFIERKQSGIVVDSPHHIFFKFLLLLLVHSLDTIHLC